MDMMLKPRVHASSMTVSVRCKLKLKLHGPELAVMCDKCPVQMNVLRNGLTASRFQISAVPAIYYVSGLRLHRFEGAHNADAVRSLIYDLP